MRTLEPEHGGGIEDDNYEFTFKHVSIRNGDPSNEEALPSQIEEFP